MYWKKGTNISGKYVSLEISVTVLLEMLRLIISRMRTAYGPRTFRKSINKILKGPKRDTVAHEFLDNTTVAKIAQENICDFFNTYYANIGMANLVNDQCA